MNIVLFCHSLLSDWNHGNAHFLRGLVSELSARGHRVRSFEPEDAWSVQNLLLEAGELPLAELRRHYPGLDITRYSSRKLDVAQAVDGADVVVVHEWNEPAVVQALGRLRLRSSSRFTLLFHDTHHRSVTDPAALQQLDLTGYDGVLAFGEAVRERYLDAGWARRVFTFHEAADVRVFRPQPEVTPEADLVWIGNWGDDERTRELDEFLFTPVKALGLSGAVHGVRYPAQGLAAVASAGLTHRGWLPNYRVPEVFARHRVTVHVPRRPYAEALPGVPTIRVFEALACGIPLISAPWSDAERLFRPTDFLWARDGREMQDALVELTRDRKAAQELAARGRETILARHTCGHRADQLLEITAELSGLTPFASTDVARGSAEAF